MFVVELAGLQAVMEPMPTIVTTEYVDDLDGVSVDVKSVDTVDFSYRRVDYTLVLTAANGAQFHKYMARYIKAAKKARAQVLRAARVGTRKSTAKAEATAAPRKAASERKAAAPRKIASRKVDAAPDGPKSAKVIRDWAAAHGHAVSPRGRIAASVTEAFDAAH